MINVTKNNQKIFLSRASSSSTGHTHDDYYTEVESDARFSSTGHLHDDRYYTEVESDARFSSTGHLHDDRYVVLTDYEDLDILNKVKNVDGLGSGLDSDLLDGHDSTFFSSTGHLHKHNDTTDKQGGTIDQYYHLTSAGYTIATQSATLSRDGYLTSTDFTTFNNKADKIFAIAMAVSLG